MSDIHQPEFSKAAIILVGFALYASTISLLSVVSVNCERLL